MKTQSWHHFDFWLLGSVGLLTIFGITVIRSAIAGNFDLDGFDQRQLIFAGIGLVILFITAAIDYRLWRAANKIIYFSIIILLIILNFFGEGLFGSARWFSVGPILIQPSEFAKIIVILALANYFGANKKKEKNLWWISKSLILTVFVVIWILLQPDMSTSIVILVIWLAMLWASGLKMNHFFSAIGVATLVILIGLPLILMSYNPDTDAGLIKAYQIERVINFLFPDPSARFGANYNVQQALISIGSGGWFGKGYGSGSQVQLRFLKVRHSDFIFSAMAEEFGFLGTVSVMALLLFIVIRCLRTARLAHDTYGALIAYGVATLITFQAMVNIGMNLKLLPVTGLTLPFVSYGGSSLISLYLSIGLVQSVIIRHKVLDF